MAEPACSVPTPRLGDAASKEGLGSLGHESSLPAFELARCAQWLPEARRPGLLPQYTPSSLRPRCEFAHSWERERGGTQTTIQGRKPKEMKRLGAQMVKPGPSKALSIKLGVAAHTCNLGDLKAGVRERSGSTSATT